MLKGGKNREAPHDSKNRIPSLGNCLPTSSLSSIVLLHQSCHILSYYQYWNVGYLFCGLQKLKPWKCLYITNNKATKRKGMRLKTPKQFATNSLKVTGKLQLAGVVWSKENGSCKSEVACKISVLMWLEQRGRRCGWAVSTSRRPSPVCHSVGSWSVWQEGERGPPGEQVGVLQLCLSVHRWALRLQVVQTTHPIHAPLSSNH